jgi:hypothetical protein
MFKGRERLRSQGDEAQNSKKLSYLSTFNFLYLFLEGISLGLGSYQNGLIRLLDERPGGDFGTISVRALELVRPRGTIPDFDPIGTLSFFSCRYRRI